MKKDKKLRKCHAIIEKCVYICSVDTENDGNIQV